MKALKDYQNKLFPYAYNILGSSEDAKDAIQDILVNYLSKKKSDIENEIGYLIKAVINQSINLKKQKSKFTSDKTWLPEPISTENPDSGINKSEIISYSILVLLENLTPTERAIFMLKKAFDYSHHEIAEKLNITIDNSRKILSRAKNKLSKNNTTENKKPISLPTSYMQKYIEVIKNGDTAKLEKLLTKEISLTADGGGNIKVVREFTTGDNATAKLLLYVYKTFQKSQRVEISEINHQPALLFFENNNIVTCQVFDIRENGIVSIHAILDPVKLNSLS